MYNKLLGHSLLNGTREKLGHSHETRQINDGQNCKSKFKFEDKYDNLHNDEDLWTMVPVVNIEHDKI